MIEVFVSGILLKEQRAWGMSADGQWVTFNAPKPILKAAADMIMITDEPVRIEVHDDWIIEAPESDIDGRRRTIYGEAARRRLDAYNGWR